MGLDFLAQHGAKAIKNAASINTSSKNFPQENIWFKLGNNEEHTIRIVGNFITTHSHWIGKSNFGKDVPLLNEKAFQGENKLPMTVACGNWDIETETSDPDGNNCPVCRIIRNIEYMTKKYGKDMDPADKETFKNLRGKIKIKPQYLFKIIDRDNPYLDEGHTRKGYKILRTDVNFLEVLTALSKSLNEEAKSEEEMVYISAPDGGIDLKVKKVSSENSKGSTYSILPVLKGGVLKKTPLDEEEQAYRDLDLLKFAGKQIDISRFEAELVDETQSPAKLIYNYDIEADANGGTAEPVEPADNTDSEEGGNIPF